MSIERNKGFIEVLWNKIYSDKEFKRLVARFRDIFRRDRFPRNGFASKRQFFQWKRTYFVSEGEEKKFEYMLDKYTKLVKREFSFINLKSFEIVIRSAFLYRKAHYLDAGKVDFSNIKLRNSKVLFYSRKTLKKIEHHFKNGIFISISPFANISDIKKFLDKKSKLIKVYQRKLIREIGMEGFTEEGLKNFERDQMVMTLWHMSHTELSKLGGGENRYKDIQIANIMTGWGYEVSNDNVRKIASTKSDFFS